MEVLLSIAEVATRLDVSHPYALMLCDAGLLGKALTEGGHRRVEAVAVDAYLAARVREREGVPLPREAGILAGLYDHPDSHYRTRRP